MSGTHKHTHLHAHEPSINIKHIQTLSHAQYVWSLDMRTWPCQCPYNKGKGKGKTAATTVLLLITGQDNGDISLFNTPLSNIHFKLQKVLHAPRMGITALHFHRYKSLFLSASEDGNVKIWTLKDMNTPCLMKCIRHPDGVSCAKYAYSGRLLTGCNDRVIRVYGKEPLFSLLWSVKLSGDICSVAWSPSNRLAALFAVSVNSLIVQVWDVSFQSLFKHTQTGAVLGIQTLAFVSNDLLIFSGGFSKTLYRYHMMSKSKVTNVLMETIALPFCKDVLHIIVRYLPLETHIKVDSYVRSVGAVTAFSSQVVGLSCFDSILRVYTVCGNEKRLLASLSHEYCGDLVCVYPGGSETGLVLASPHLTQSVSV